MHMLTIASHSCHALVTKNDPLRPTINFDGLDPRDNADSYALFAMWTWMLPQQQRQCPNLYPLWNATASEGGITPVGSGTVTTGSGQFAAMPQPSLD